MLVNASVAACGDDDGANPGTAPAAVELHAPETCEECHDKHYREWSASMHAYAAEDPIFLAMNQRGQTETDGELGDFCVGCHAPMAVRLGLTNDGLNLEEVADRYKGVTCYFCHNVDSVAARHDNPLGIPANNPLVLARDITMRGGVMDARRPSAHEVAYSPLHDGDLAESGQLCGPCHDIVTTSGVHLERTFEEWKNSVFSRTGGASFNSCIGCHMSSRNDLIARTSAVALAARPHGFHNHLMPGVDAALTPFPDQDVQLLAIECELAEAVRITSLTVTEDGRVTVEAETSRTGHGWPSGSAQDRRAWMEVRAYDDLGAVRVGIGAIADDEPLPSPAEDRRLFVMRDFIYGAEGEEVHMFWEATPSQERATGYRSTTLPVAVPPRQPGSAPPSHSVEKSFTTFTDPARVEVVVKIRPLGFDLIDDLVATGHLARDNDFKSKIKTHTLNLTKMIWDRDVEGGSRVVTSPANNPLDCPNRWLCALYGDRPECN